jgi:hypothetical protein
MTPNGYKYIRATTCKGDAMNSPSAALIQEKEVLMISLPVIGNVIMCGLKFHLFCLHNSNQTFFIFFEAPDHESRIVYAELPPKV